MMVKAGLADPWVGQTLPSLMNRLGTRPGALVGVDDAVVGRGAHPGSADQVGEALDGEHVLGARGVEDVVDDLGRVGDVGFVVVAEAVVEAGHRQPVGVRLRRPG